MKMDGITRSSMLMQKMVDGSPVVNLYRQWGVICTKIPMPKIESKDIPVRDDKGEDGEDAYIPSHLPVKAYDLTIEFGYVGEIGLCYTNIFNGFLAYLLGTPPTVTGYDAITEGGFKMYDKYNGIGRRKVYLKTFDPDGLIYLDDGDHLTFKLTFRITDPITDIMLIDPESKITLP